MGVTNMTDFNALVGSYEGAAGATAFARGMSPERMAERATAYTEIEARNQQLKRLKATEPTEQDLRTMAETQTAELQGALQKQQEMLREGNKRRTFDAYERYDSDGDVRHLNVMLQDLEKTGSKLYGKIARVDKLTENDRQMLDDMGLPPQLIDLILTDPELNKSYVKITQKDGTTSFGDLDVLKGLTGYNDYADQKELARQQTARQIEQLAIMGYDLDPLGREAFRRTRAELGYNVDPKSPEFQNKYSEIYDELQRNKKRGTTAAASIGGMGNPTEAEAEAIRRAALEGLHEGDPGWEQAVSRHMSNVKTEWGRPSATRNIEAAETARTQLEDEGFWDMDFEDLNPSQRGRIEAKIRRIEELGGAKLSASDRTTMERIKRLTSYGEVASELTDEQTGIIDSLFRQVKKYVADDPEGIKAESAYSAFRNLIKHDLYGASLQPGESANFAKQFGSLLQQRGPVLAQLRTTLTEIKDAYESLQRMNDPMVVAWRTGKTGSELQDVIDNLDDRIEMLNNIAANKPVTTISPPVPEDANRGVLTPERREGLKKIWEGGRSGGTM